jgi:hypothetical protein
MSVGTERQIARLSAICGFLTLLAFIVPRFVPNREGGFASAATAILVFLGILLATAMLSIRLLLLTVQRYSEISVASRIVGITPSVLLVTGLALLLAFLRY